jgi:hypothetical protein
VRRWYEVGPELLKIGQLVKKSVCVMVGESTHVDTRARRISYCLLI